MIKIGTADTTNREIFYLSTLDENWTDLLPSQNWLAFLIVEGKNDPLLDRVAYVCLNRNVIYVCTVGQECEYAHDWFDETIVARKIELGQSIATGDDFKGSPMTTWHNDFEEGFWFALIPANDGVKEISIVVCIDLTMDDHEDKLSELVVKINNGWLPND